VRMLGDGALRERLGQAARCRFEEELQAGRMVEQTRSVYGAGLAR
jgi:hypothetical protein